MKTFLLGATVLLTVFSAGAQTLKIGTNPFYKPFEFTNEKNEIIGFDADLMTALCNEMNVECQFVAQHFDTLIPSLMTRKIDVVISGMDITETRQKQVNFTAPYYANSAVFVTTTQSGITAPDELTEKKIAVQNGTTHQRYLLDNFPHIKVVSYDSYPTAFMDLKNGRVNAVLSDTAVSAEFIQQDPQLVTIGEKITDPDYFGIGLGIATRKKNTQLAQQLDDALTQLKENGTYEKIYKKWFPE